MLKFHELTVAQVSPDAEDAVSIALAVPPQLQAEYRGSPGQHIVVRLSVDGRDLGLAFFRIVKSAQAGPQAGAPQAGSPTAVSK